MDIRKIIARKENIRMKTVLNKDIPTSISNIPKRYIKVILSIPNRLMNSINQIGVQALIQ